MRQTVNTPNPQPVAQPAVPALEPMTPRASRSRWWLGLVIWSLFFLVLFGFIR